MGIDFSNCDASWSYSGFYRFRKRLAAAAGFDLTQMDGFEGHKPWSEIKDALVPFLNHSDCEGTLSPKQCEKIAPRLKQVISLWPDDYDKMKALELIKGMRVAVKSKKSLRFM